MLLCFKNICQKDNEAFPFIYNAVSHRCTYITAFTVWCEPILITLMKKTHPQLLKISKSELRKVKGTGGLQLRRNFTAAFTIALSRYQWQRPCSNYFLFYIIRNCLNTNFKYKHLLWIYWSQDKEYSYVCHKKGLITGSLLTLLISHFLPNQITCHPYPSFSYPVSLLPFIVTCLSQAI